MLNLALSAILIVLNLTLLESINSQYTFLLAQEKVNYLHEYQQKHYISFQKIPPSQIISKPYYFFKIPQSNDL